MERFVIRKQSQDKSATYSKIQKIRYFQDTLNEMERDTVMNVKGQYTKKKICPIGNQVCMVNDTCSSRIISYASTEQIQRNSQLSNKIISHGSSSIKSPSPNSTFNVTFKNFTNFIHLKRKIVRKEKPAKSSGTIKSNTKLNFLSHFQESKDFIASILFLFICQIFLMKYLIDTRRD